MRVCFLLSMSIKILGGFLLLFSLMMTYVTHVGHNFFIRGKPEGDVISYRNVLKLRVVFR